MFACEVFSLYSLLLLFSVVYKLYAGADFNITASSWDAYEIVENVNISVGPTLNIRNAGSGNDGTNMFLFGGQNWATTKNYTNVFVFNGETHELSTELWSVWDSTSISKFVIYPNQIAQEYQSSNNIYIAAHGLTIYIVHCTRKYFCYSFVF